MNCQELSALRAIGCQLDLHQFPRVYNGGFVQPSEATVYRSTLGKEKKNGTSRQARPATGPRQGAARWQRQTDRPWTSGRTSSVISAGLREQYEANLDAVLEAYPGTTTWFQREGMWLLTESALLSGMSKKATFLIAVPFIPEIKVRAWGFWTTLISNTWIGPRHTNFPDGSVCAFEPKDETWVSGGSLVKLLDLYTLWALRHLYLEVFGRWPGYQSVPHAYERIQELKDDEFCGCEKSNKPYADCCKSNDLAQDQNALATEFLCKLPMFGLRQPPGDVLRFVRDRGHVPTLSEIFSQCHT